VSQITSHAATLIAPPNLVAQKQRPIKRPEWCHMLFGFIVNPEIARERGIATFGPGLTEEDFDRFESKYTLRLHAQCSLLWRTRLRVVRFGNSFANCITLGENTSESAMKVPPEEIIDKMKVLLGTKEEPKWYRCYS
jgi:hypothetical protein